MGGNKATVSPGQFASASTPRSASRSAPRGRAEPSPGPFTNAGLLTSPGESAALTPAQGLRAQSGLLAPARRTTPAFQSPGESTPPRRRSLLDPFQDDTEAPPRRNDVLPGGFGGHVMSGEDSAANRRFAASLTRGGDIGAIAPIIRGAMKNNPARATVELADLSRQTHALDPGSGAKLDRILDTEAKALGLPSPVAAKAPAAGGSESQAPGPGRERASRGVTSPGEEAVAANPKPANARTPPGSKSGVQRPHRMDNASASRIVQDIASGKGDLPAPTVSPDGKTDIIIGGYRLDKDAAAALRMAVRATPETAAEAMREIAGLRFVPNDKPGGFMNTVKKGNFTEKLDAVQKGELARIVQDTKKGRSLSTLPPEERRARITGLLMALDRRNRVARDIGALIGAGFAPAGGARGRTKIPKTVETALDGLRKSLGVSVSESQKKKSRNKPRSEN